jgi:TPR repeat protein
VAKQWYKKAANAGHAEAQYALAMLDFIGIDGQPDYEAALAMFHKSANGWDRNAQYYLGHQYYYGLGVKKDAMEAYKWFDLSAANGHVGAHYMRSIVAHHLTEKQVGTAHKNALQWFDANHDNPHKHYDLKPHSH